MTIDEIKSAEGYESERHHTIDGREVVELYNESDADAFIGLPCFVVPGRNGWRRADPEEVLDILGKL